jgi:hypothetical protein
MFYHKSLKDSKGNPLKAKRNGQNKLWKTRPNDFQIPVKRGLYDFGYINQDNCLEWTV